MTPKFTVAFESPETWQSRAGRKPTPIPPEYFALINKALSDNLVARFTVAETETPAVVKLLRLAGKRHGDVRVEIAQTPGPKGTVSLAVRVRPKGQ